MFLARKEGSAPAGCRKGCMREREEINSQNRGRDGTRATHTRALYILDIRASAVRRVGKYQLGCFEMAGLGHERYASDRK
jgi:hypothetical protein